VFTQGLKQNTNDSSWWYRWSYTYQNMIEVVSCLYLPFGSCFPMRHTMISYQWIVIRTPSVEIFALTLFLYVLDPALSLYSSVLPPKRLHAPQLSNLPLPSWPNQFLSLPLSQSLTSTPFIEDFSRKAVQRTMIYRRRSQIRGRKIKGTRLLTGTT
jgi:hypothetical protein